MFHYHKGVCYEEGYVGDQKCEHTSETSGGVGEIGTTVQIGKDASITRPHPGGLEKGSSTHGQGQLPHHYQLLEGTNGAVS